MITIVLLLIVLDLWSEIQMAPTVTRFNRRLHGTNSNRRSMCNYNGNARSGKVNIPNPTNTTFYTLPENILPIRYRLRLRIDQTKRRVYGYALINIFIENKTSLIEMNSLGLNINGATFKTKNIRGKFKTLFLN